MTLSAVHHRTIRHRGNWLMLLMLLGLHLPMVASAGEAGDEPSRVVTKFYNLYLAIRPLGVPQENKLAKLRPYLSTALGQGLHAAQEAEQGYLKITRGEAPPLVEGDLFTSLFEGATAFRVLACEMQNAAANCSIEFTYIDARDGSSQKWQDKVYLIQQSRRWLMDDIEYLGTWQFMHRGRLKTLLKQVVEDSKRK